MFSAKNRHQITEQLKSEEFDLVIIGGGINGVGVARDASSRGMKVAVIESRDFAFGTSSRSSKLIHGGIRYLENLEFGLVFEALSERKALFEIAPNMVHPLKFVIPMYESSKVSMFKMGLGMWLYDALSLFDAPESHERLSVEEALKRLPWLQPHELVGAYAYYDAYMDDDRLVIETLRSAVKLGATAISYTTVNKAATMNGRVTALNCQDQVTGEQYIVRGRHFIGGLGPWTDIFGEHIFKEWTPTLRPTKGVHLTFDRNRLPLKEAIVMIDDEKGRIVFGIPRHEMVIIGTTDTDFKGNPAFVHTTEEDVEYLLKMIGEYFPGSGITRSDIVASYSGVRPLVRDNSSSEGKTSREHKIWTDPRNITFVAGGKYTTYRLISEEIVDQALTVFPIEDKVKFGRSNTKVPLNSCATIEALEAARSKTESWGELTSLSAEELKLLAERHGLEAETMIRAAQAKGYSTIWQIEALHAIDEQMCFHLDDFYIRRVPLFLSRKDHGLEFLPEIIQVFAKELSWKPDQIQAEKKRLEDHRHHEMSWL